MYYIGKPQSEIRSALSGVLLGRGLAQGSRQSLKTGRPPWTYLGGPDLGPRINKPMSTLRFHPGRRHFDHGIVVAPPMEREEATAKFAAGDHHAIVAGHVWLAVDLARRCLHSRELPAHLGEELTTVAIGAMWSALERTKLPPNNPAAFLSASAEGAMIEYCERDSLCHVPPRTRRDRKAKKLDAAKAPRIISISAFGEDSRSASGVVDSMRKKATWTAWMATLGWQTVSDIYPYCADRLDRDLVDLRYDEGAGPVCLEECAGILGLPYKRVEARLNALEARVYRALGRAIPSRRRDRGKWLNTLRKSA